MKQAHETLPLRELIAVLQSLCKDRRTGTMFLHTDTNHSARIGMEQGRIFFIAYGRYRGMEAIEKIKQMQYGKFSFAESVFNNAAEIPLPPTGELLTQLSWAAVGDPRGGSASADHFAGWTGVPPSAPDLTAPPPVAPPAAFANLPLPGSAEDLTPAEEPLRLTGQRLYDAVAQALALSIGPVASMVCDDYRDRLVALTTPSELRALAAQIASEIGDDDEARRFLGRALAAAGL